MINITGSPPDAVKVGAPVRAVFETAAEGIGLPKFQLA